MPAGTDDLRDRFRGCLLGVAVGDALGAPFEGRARVDAAEVERWARADGPLRWTDDTHMTIGLARSLVARCGLDGPHLAAELARGYRAEPWRGYGAGPPRVFAALGAGAAWDEPARSLFGGEGSFGNGAAMRAAPIGLVAHRTPDTVVSWARRSALVTHAHELGRQAAALQARAVAHLVSASPATLGRRLLLADLRAAAPDAAFQEQLDRVEGLGPDTAPTEAAAALGHGVSGVEAVPAALHAFLRDPASFASAVRGAVALGGDTDTIASMTGALGGALLGETAIPESWLARVEAAAQLRDLADALLELGTSLRSG